MECNTSYFLLNLLLMNKTIFLYLGSFPVNILVFHFVNSCLNKHFLILCPNTNIESALLIYSHYVMLWWEVEGRQVCYSEGRGESKAMENCIT